MSLPHDPAHAVLRTIAVAASAELPRISGSRFLAVATPTPSRHDVAAAVDLARSVGPDATHHCWASVLPDATARSSDDGEPRDTAGAPILRHILGADLAGVTVVVTRWFGGTKLGRGGLVRAYGDAAAAALAAAEIVERPRLATFRLVHAYDLTAAVDGVLAGCDARIVSAAYGARVEQLVSVPVAAADGFTDALVEATAGRVRPERTGSTDG